MTFDDILAALRTEPPAAAEVLREAVAHADALAPVVLPLAEKKARGVYLLPDDDNLLFHGLFVLAAARHLPLWPHLIALVRMPEDEVEAYFGYEAQMYLGQLMLSVWSGDGGEILRLIEHADIGLEGKWALLDVLSRLTCDGRLPRAETVAFLERCATDGLFDADDLIWLAWSSAVALLGAAELKPVWEAARLKSVFADLQEADHVGATAEFDAAIAASVDPSRFVEQRIVPVDDPAVALRSLYAWAERHADSHDTHTQDVGGQERASDGARTVAHGLTEDEVLWLEGFLASRQVPDSTMSLEMVDGMLTAFAIGPARMLPADWRPLIWDPDGKAAPAWDGPAQADYVHRLLDRHVAALGAICREGGTFEPGIEPMGDAEVGRDWAEAFLFGVDLLEDAWASFFEDERGYDMLLMFEALAGDRPELFDERITPEKRRRIVEQVPEVLATMAAFWRDGKQFPRREPVRTIKVGRNDPCPCGSGKKYKKCCGAAPPPVLH